MRTLFLASLSAALLASCSGGNGGSTPTPTPTPVNQPPSFTSAAAVSVPENTSGTIYTATATDPEGAPVTFSLTGGDDVSLFTLTGANLSFKMPPDYEAPADLNHDNVYQVEITASDGTNNVKLLLAVTVTDIGPSGYSLKVMGRPFTGVERLTAGAIAEDAGSYRCYDYANARYDARLCNSLVSGGVGTSDFSYQEERGLLGWAPAPRRPDWAGLATDRYTVIVYTAANGDLMVVWAAILDTILPSTKTWIQPVPGRPPIWRIPNTATRNLGGWAQFGRDGYLYIIFGDGTDASRAQDPNSPFGKIWRIDPYKDDYPADADRNFGAPATGGMLAALGLRSPDRFSMDANGNIILGDRGESAREEINVLLAGESNVNFGWPYREGSLVRQSGEPAGLRAPAIELEHGTGPVQSNRIVSGAIYTGSAAAIRDQYVFGDTSGKLWMIPAARLLLGHLTGADLTRTEDLLFSRGHPLENLVSIVGSSTLTLTDDSGLYYVLSAP